VAYLFIRADLRVYMANISGQIMEGVEWLFMILDKIHGSCPEKNNLAQSDTIWAFDFNKLPLSR